MANQENFEKLVYEFQYLRGVSDSIQQRIEMINATVGEIQIATATLEGISGEKPGSSMLVPIGGGSYVWAKLDDHEKIIVGVNKFTIDQAEHIPVFRIYGSIQQTQVSKLVEFKKNRDQARVAQCLEEIKKAAVDGTNLMPLVVSAVEAHCTLGEISDVLRSVFGEHH
jgi:hypothetical protein